MTSFKACFPSPARHTCVEFVVLYLDRGGLPLMPSQERRRDHSSDRQVGQTTIGVTINSLLAATASLAALAAA
jgi:hypothetical protein